MRMNPVHRYLPLINPADRIVRKPLQAWRAELVQTLREAIRTSNVNPENLAPCFNQLALLEAFQGNTAGALLACQAQIRFLQRIAQQPGNEHYLYLVVQPWINVLRLERWSNKLDSSLALYSELGPARRTTMGSLQQRFGLSLTLEELVRFDSSGGMARVLDNVYWREYGHLLLGANAGKDMQQHLQAGLRQVDTTFLRVALLEMLFLYQASTGSAGHALSLLRKMKVDQSGWTALPLKTLEVYLASVSGNGGTAELADAVVIAASSGDHVQHEAQALGLLVDIARVFQNLGMTRHELAVLEQAHQFVDEVGDEVLNFEVMSRLAVLLPDTHWELGKQFSGSSYAAVRRKIGLGLDTAEGASDIVLALQSLADLKYDTCTALLTRCAVMQTGRQEGLVSA